MLSRVRNERDGGDAQDDGGDEAPPLADEVPLFRLEGAQLARIGDGVADIPQRLEERLGPRDLWIVFDERLLMRETHRDLVDARHASERLFDGPSTQGAMQATDPGANLLSVRTARRLFGPGDGGAHGATVYPARSTQDRTSLSDARAASNITRTRAARRSAALCTTPSIWASARRMRCSHAPHDIPFT